MTSQQIERVVPWLFHSLAAVLLAIVGYWSVRLEGRIDTLEGGRLDRARQSTTVEVELRHVSTTVNEIRNDMKALASKFSSIESAIMRLELGGDQGERP